MTNSADRDIFPWVFGGLLLVLVAIAIGYTSRNQSHLPASVPRIQSSAAPLPAQVSRPPTVTARNSGAPTPVPRRVWECAVNGQRTFSDSPCGTTSTVRQLSEVNRMDPTPVPPAVTYYNPPSPSYAPNYTAQSYDNSANDSSVCESLKEAVNAIHERMRHLYTNPEGNYYRARLREISDRQDELHCDR
jgi:hypothetical protein